ncbi:hypothetical protein ACP70R_000052 [Stipagrostis hirtigluma subsp. patula]
MAQQTVILRVGMSCEGCVGAVKRVLGKMEVCHLNWVQFSVSTSNLNLNLPDQALQLPTGTGRRYCKNDRRILESVESFDVDIKEQKVTVKGNVTPDAVLQTVSKTGKKTSFWEAEPATNQSAASADATATAS